MEPSSATDSKPADSSLLSQSTNDSSLFLDLHQTEGISESLPDDVTLALISRENVFLQPEFGCSKPSQRPKTDDLETFVAAELAGFGATIGPEIHLVPKYAEDDITVSSRPTKQVDYLSHTWKEEDIWSSRSYVISKRGELTNSSRLENASWRTWMKARNNLKTIAPEELNWYVPCFASSKIFCTDQRQYRLKDADITWLYGPFQSGSKYLIATKAEPSDRTIPRKDLPVLKKKPILKRKRMSEAMVQGSLASEQVRGVVQAQTIQYDLKYNAHKSNPDSQVT
jgi:hypothetical protein